MTITDSSTQSISFESEHPVFLVPNQVQKYAQATSIQHWQLRNSLLCPFDGDHVLFIHNSSIQQLDLRTMKKEVQLGDLNFRPASMGCQYGYVAAGGQNSQLIVRHIATNICGQIMTGGSINNAIEISRHFNEDRILVCNNDESLKIFTLPTLNLVASLTFPAAVNASAVSPDGSKLVVVGDTNDVFLHGLNSSPGSSMPEYSLIKTLKSCNDSSFSVSWHPSSSIFAIGCQDGFVCLYDIRQLSKKLATLEAHQSNREKKAVRKVMFSPSGSIDLLLFAEHMNFVNLVDTRNFEEKQVIRLTDTFEDRHITGITFSPDSAKIFASLDDTIIEYQVNSLQRRTFFSKTVV